ncbi:MAG: class I SAM-dependent methyltransferase [Terriglobia bacterium]
MALQTSSSQRVCTIGGFLCLQNHELCGLGSCVLEVAPGPGYFAIELAKLGKYKITGLDISKTFVELARKNAEKEGVEVDFRQGNAAHMLFECDSFDLIFCRAAFKNFAEPAAALKEMYRVLRAGGKALIIDLRRDAPKKAIDIAVDRMDLGAVNSVITKWTFRLMLIKRAYTRDEFNRFIAESGFRKVDIQDTPTGFEISLFK